MKKIISIKPIMIILISVLLIAVSTTVFASDLVPGNNNNENTNNNNATTITGNEYNEAQNNNTNNNVNNSNTNTNTSLPQTGIEDHGTGILLVICIASAMFAYKKINDYRSI